MRQPCSSSCDLAAASSAAVSSWVWQVVTLLLVQVSTHTITILLGLVFCVINPLLAPICVVYFAITYMTERYNMLYIERPQYHAGGKVILPLLSFPATAMCQPMPRPITPAVAQGYSSSLTHARLNLKPVLVCRCGARCSRMSSQPCCSSRSSWLPCWPSSRASLPSW